MIRAGYARSAGFHSENSPSMVGNNLYIENTIKGMFKKIFIAIWLTGFVLLCAFRAPVKYYQYYDRYIVIHTHIFSDKGKILAGQFILYTLIWSVIVFLAYAGLSYFKKNK
jgi:hypothetical protein